MAGNASRCGKERFAVFMLISLPTEKVGPTAADRAKPSSEWSGLRSIGDDRAFH
jgi:hypothetical protein